MNRTYLRGDMYFADLGKGIGSEQEGNRPVVIIQNNTGNKHSPTVIVASITSRTAAKLKLPTHYYVGPGNGLTSPSVVLLEQIRTIDKRRLDRYIGRLSEQEMQKLNIALAISIDLIENIPDSMMMCLCRTCEEEFRNAGAYYLYPVHREQKETDTCTHCNVRNGLDFVVIRKNQEDSL